MNEKQKKALELLKEQQKGMDQYTPAFMVGEQLKEIARREPESAELLAEDLAVKGKSIKDAEKLISAEAAKHKKGNSACVAPWTAEDILRKFYGLRERSWGPGKEAKDPATPRDEAISSPSGDQKGSQKGKLIDLADFL